MLNLSGNIRILLLGLLTISLFPFVGFVIFYFIEGDAASFLNIFSTKIGYSQELIIGLFSGLLFGVIAWFLITSPFLSSVLFKYGGVIQSLKLGVPSIILVSICAGVGEEIFFRGVLQDYFGVVITAIVFVAIHGYLSISDWRISIYGLYMTTVIVLIGFMDQYLGLTSAMMAHTVIDIVLFYLLTNSPKINESIIHLE